MEKCRIAIIGCGAIARKRHAPVCAAHPKAELYAVCDINHTYADEMAQQYGAKSYYSVESVLQDDLVDAVIICLPERMHHKVVISALSAGKHVLCEKPMAMNTAEAAEMEEAGRKSGKMLMIAFSQRLYSVHKKTKDLLDNNEIGRVLSFRTYLTQPGVESFTISNAAADFYDRNLNNIGGVLLSVGCHRIDLMRYLFDDEIDSLAAYTPTLDKKYSDGRLIRAEDQAMIILKMKNGIAGTIWVSWCNYGNSEKNTVIYGTGGTISTYEDGGVAVYKKDGYRKYYPCADDARETGSITANFINTLLGEEKPVCTAADGLECMRIIDAAKQSGKMMTWVRI